MPADPTKTHTIEFTLYDGSKVTFCGVPRWILAEILLQREEHVSSEEIIKWLNLQGMVSTANATNAEGIESLLSFNKPEVDYGIHPPIPPDNMKENTQ